MLSDHPHKCHGFRFDFRHSLIAFSLRKQLHGGVIVCAKIDNDDIRIKAEIIGGVPCLCEGTGTFIDSRNIAVFIVLPVRVNAPSAHGHGLNICAERRGKQLGICAGWTEVQGVPFLISACTDNPLAACDAVTDKLDSQRCRFHGSETAVAAEMRQIAVAFPVILDRLRFPDNFNFMKTSIH